MQLPRGNFSPKEKQRARVLLREAIERGEVSRGPCEVSGCDLPTEGHHEDYSKPLEVRWLCRGHHKRLHEQDNPPKTRGVRRLSGDKKSLTQRQFEVLEFIVESTREHGFAPTIREIGDGVGISSTNGIADHLTALERKKWLRRDRLRPRTITVDLERFNAERAVRAAKAASSSTCAGGGA